MTDNAFRTIRRTLAFYARGKDEERAQVLLDEIQGSLIAHRNAPSNTASAMTVEQWAKAWQDEWQRANRAEVELEELREANRLRDEQRKAAE